MIPSIKFGDPEIQNFYIYHVIYDISSVCFRAAFAGICACFRSVFLLEVLDITVFWQRKKIEKYKRGGPVGLPFFSVLDKEKSLHGKS